MIGENDISQSVSHSSGTSTFNIQHSKLLLILLVTSYTLVLWAGLSYKLFTWSQGYDQIDYQQSIWNTTQGRFLEISHYRHTDSLWGMDFIPAILLIVPFYALFPSPLTLNFFQALCMALGALPTYGVARDRFGSQRAGLLWAAIYLLYPSVWFVTMSAPWQPRTLAVPALIGAFYYLQGSGVGGRESGKPPDPVAPPHLVQTQDIASLHSSSSFTKFMLCLLLALTTRTDTSLVVICFGLLALLWRRRWPWAVLPIVLGLGWFWLSTNVIVPNSYRADYQPRVVESSGDACLDYSKNWPGKSPQLAYYCHLGGSAGEIVKTVLTRPVYVASIVFTPEKMRYVLLMLLPLLLLPLLAPDVALLAAAPLAMNLLSLRPFQITVREQYQTLLIPGLIVAAIIGAARLWQWKHASAMRWGTIAGLGLLVCALLLNLAYINPVLSTIRNTETPERLAAMRQIATLIPKDAALGATSFLAPNMMPRRYMFYFPPDASLPPPERADYLFIDRRAAALKRTNVFEQILASPEWQVVAEQEDIVLLRRAKR